MYLSFSKGETFIQASVYNVSAEANGLYLQTAGYPANRDENEAGFDQIECKAMPSEAVLKNFSTVEVPATENEPAIPAFAQNLDVKVQPATHDIQYRLSIEHSVVINGRVFNKVIAD